MRLTVTQTSLINWQHKKLLKVVLSVLTWEVWMIHRVRDSDAIFNLNWIQPGAIIFGGIDTKKYSGALVQRPIIPVPDTPDQFPRLVGSVLCLVQFLLMCLVTGSIWPQRELPSPERAPRSILLPPATPRASPFSSTVVRLSATFPRPYSTISSPISLVLRSTRLPRCILLIAH